MSERSKAVRSRSVSLLGGKFPVLEFFFEVLTCRLLLYAAVLLRVAPETPLLPTTNQK